MFLIGAVTFLNNDTIFHEYNNSNANHRLRTGITDEWMER